MKKFLVTLLLLVTMFPFAAKAQSQLTVYDGTATNACFPFYVYYCDAMSTSQWIVPASDITVMKNASITSLTFYISQTQPSCGCDWELYMMETSATTLSGIIDYSTATKVFDGALNTTASTMTITLSTPFNYTGSNLFFCSRNKTIGNYKGVYWYGENGHTNASYYNFQYKATSSFLPKTTFTYMVSTGIEMTPVAFGDRPNNAWMEPVAVELGGGVYNVTAMDIDNDYFTFDGPRTPFTTPANMTVTTGNAEVGEVTGNVSFFYNGSKELKTFEVTANAYNPVNGDVVEKAINVTSYPYTNTPNFGAIYHNYNLPGDATTGKDAAYKLTFANDVMLTANVGAAADGKVALYRSGFEGEGGPMATNAYEYNGPQVNPGEVVDTWYVPEYTGTNTFYGSSTGGMLFGYCIPADVIEELGLYNGCLYAVEAAAREAYPYNLYLFRGATMPQTLIYAQEMVGSASALSYFHMDLNTPVEVGTDNLWVFFDTDSPYSAYCGKDPVNTDTKIWYTFDGSSWYVSSTYTPMIYCHIMTPTGREEIVNLADLSISHVEGTVEEMNDRAVVNTTASIAASIKAQRESLRGLGEGMYVPAGTYYLVAQSTEAFTTNISTAVAPKPVQAIVNNPVDGQVNVPSPVAATWTIGNYTQEMQVKLGTQYPPQDILLDWTEELVDGIILTGLVPNTSYFLQVNEKNGNGITYGEIIGFTTVLEAPELDIETPMLYPGDAAQLSWEMDRSFRGYNVYVDGEKWNETLVVDDEYAVEGLAYGLHTFNVTAVYDEGESDYSNEVMAYMTGFGHVAGTVYEQDGTTPIEGAEVYFTGTDFFGNAQTFMFLTAANGAFTGNVLEGDYVAYAALDGYQTTDNQEFAVAYDETISGITFSMREEFVPVGQVYSEVTDDNKANVWWSMTPANLIEDFEEGVMPEGWNQVGSYGWEITTNQPYEGTYCIKSSNAGVASSTGAVEVTVEVPFNGEMSFFVKPSSESNYDKFYFYIDGSEKLNLSGAGSWGEKTFNVSQGVHTYKFAYTKDSSVNSNDDCIYVDYVTLYRQIEPEPPFAGGWIQYDDGTYASSVGTGSASLVYWAVCWPNASAYNGLSMTKVALFDAYAGAYTITVYEGGDAAPQTAIGTTTVNGTGSNTMVEATLATPITIDGTKSLWLVGSCSSLAYPMPGCNYTGSPNSDLLSLDGTTWEHAADYGLSYTWMMRGYLSSSKGDMIVLDGAERAPQNIVRPEIAVEYGTPSTGTFKAQVAESPVYVGVPTAARMDGNGTRSFKNYKVYRQNMLNGENPQALTTTTDTCYIDNAWSSLAAGMYHYGVAAVYEGNRAEGFAEITWAEPMDKDMEVTVNVSAITNNGQPAVGALVKFVNNVEEVSYEATLDGTGFVTFEDFRCGYYTATVELPGYTTTGLQEVEAIFADKTFNVTLTEVIAPANNLFASATGWVKWDAIGGGDTPTPGAGDEFEESWDGGLNGWTNIDADGDGHVWYHSTEASSHSVLAPTSHSGAGHLMGESYCNAGSALTPNDFLVTPEKYAIANGSTFSFYACASDESYAAEHYGVAISTTGNTSANDFTTIAEWTLTAKDGAKGPRAVDGTREGSWYLKTVDLSDYAGQQVWIAIRHFNVSDQFIINIDDAALTAGSKSRAALYSIVMLDGVVAGQATSNWFQLDESTLVEGEEYTVSVASVYSTGMSDWETTTFTYWSCENFKPGVKNLAGEVEGVNNVKLTWTLPGGGGAGDEFAFSFDNDLEGWTNIDADGDGHVWYHSNDAGNHSTLAITSHSGAGHVMGESYCNGGGALTPNDYFVTPQQYHIGASSVVKFWACAQDASYAAEHFGVAISTTGNTSANDFTTLAEWTLTAKEGPKGPRAVDGSREGNWYEYTCDLSEYAGEDAWIAIRHFNCSDQFIMCLDDVTMTNAEDGNREMWDLVASFSANGAGEQGVATDGEFIYTSSWSGNPGYDFGKYTLEGTLVETFNISGATGVRDLTYDGTYFYGSSGSSAIYILDMANKTKVGQITTGATTRHLTYDPVRDAFWTGNWSDLYLYDRNGSLLQTGPAPQSAYGTGYFQTEDGEEHLYMFCQPNSDAKVYDYNITTNTLGSSPIFDFSGTPGFSAGISGGSFVGQYGDKICWFGNAQQDPNLIGIYELGEAEVPFEGNYLGAMIFRDGELITPEPLMAQQFVDENVEEGEHEYMARLAFGDVELGTLDTVWYAMSCPVYTTVEVEAPACTPVDELEAVEFDNNDGTFGVQLEWICTGANVQGYKVYRNNSYIGTTTDMEYYDDRTNNPGEYTYGVVAVYSYCESEMVEVDITVTAIDENGVVEGMYPNPTTGDLYINAAAMQQITVVNTLGQVVYNASVSGDATVLDMSAFEAGVYMVTVRTENGSSVQRITVIK